MIAARILGWSRFGLAPLLKKHFGVELDKRFQRYNWGQRPLGKKALDYAHLDTHYLIQLRQIQLTELNAQNREREAAEAFERLTQVEPTKKEFNPDDFWRIKQAKDLKPQQQAVLRELFVLRDKIARRLDRPPFKVLNDRTLIEIARIQPQNPQELKHIKGVGAKFAQYNGGNVIEAIQTGRNAPAPHHTTNNNHHRPDNRTMSRYETLRQWRNDRAAERGVEPDVIISNHTLMDIARINPKSLNNLTSVGILGEWQQETYGKELVTLLKSTSR
jgi:ribonuclease D